MASDVKKRAIMSSFDDEFIPAETVRAIEKTESPVKSETPGSGKTASSPSGKKEKTKEKAKTAENYPKEDNGNTISRKPMCFYMDEALWESLREYCFKMRMSKTEALIGFIREGLKNREQQ